MKVTCFIGLHRWGDRQYESANSCLKVSLCLRCGRKRDLSIVHEWEEWQYESPNSCLKQKACRRCGEIEKDYKKSHEWSEWDHQSPTTCVKQKVCLRCRETEKDKWESHQWGEWGDYSSPDSCKQTRTCLHCSKINTRLAHEWQEVHRYTETYYPAHVISGPSYEGNIEYSDEEVTSTKVFLKCMRCNQRTLKVI
jgi:hypothetical protein